ncbi:N-methyl-L-tryptophan oxidase [Paenibacillus sp. GCM10027627]|uniref:N-methyl-L-tryptophan oxidase n=1 Tax=unclassified Paenibacillus TaxID=185978 RepID=UPI003626240B
MSYDVIIAGAGSMGMSAGYYLARSGAKTLMIDAFDPPHTSGSHHGDSRLMRHAYSGSPVYTEMALRSDYLWRELEAEGDAALFVQSGVLNMGQWDSELLKTKEERASNYRIPIESLNADDIRGRWKGLQIPDHTRGLYEPQAGFLLSEACVQTYRNLAIRQGAKLLTHTPIITYRADGHSVSVETKEGIYYADKLILCMGAWFQTKVSQAELPIQAVRKAVGWFEAPGSLFDHTRFPGFTFSNGQGEYYGFPSYRESGVKIGRHDAGQLWKPDETFEPFGHYSEDESDLRGALNTTMPQASGRLLRGAVCKYERTPDEHFIIDNHPQHANVWLAGGFSGHGFKFASAVGELLSEKVWSGIDRYDLSPFSISRFKGCSDKTK